MPKQPAVTIPVSESLPLIAADLAALIERHESHAVDRESRVLIESLRVLLNDANARIAQ